ncbi:MAG: ABC transporter permease [Acidimicrobiales bacterium]|nr:ABC transporter permease [Acidimicrobiales bacterium]
MLGFVVRRLVASAIVLVVSSVLIYFTVTSFGDPLADLRARNPPVSQEVIDARRAELGLDEPVHERYLTWLGDVVTGDFGEDLDGQPVNEVLWRRLGRTLRMVTAAIALSLVAAVAVGVLSATRQYSKTDYFFTFSGFLFLSMPVFWLGALLKEFLAVRFNDLVGRRIVFTTGSESPRLDTDVWGRMADYAGHLILPTLALGAVSYAAWSRYQRNSMLDVMESDYIKLARAKGASRSRVVFRHGLRNALIPLTTVVAIDFGAVFGGAIITEQVFGWSAMGSLLIDGLREYDVNIVLAWMMVTGAIAIAFNLVADLLYGVLDPRIRQ